LRAALLGLRLDLASQRAERRGPLRRDVSVDGAEALEDLAWRPAAVVPGAERAHQLEVHLRALETPDACRRSLHGSGRLLGRSRAGWQRE
jgi:hypothetical protein